jgi:hypothetical protein
MEEAVRAKSTLFSRQPASPKANPDMENANLR